MKKITIPTNATAPAAPAVIAARCPDICNGSHFSYALEYYWDTNNYLLNLECKGVRSKIIKIYWGKEEIKQKENIKRSNIHIYYISTSNWIQVRQHPLTPKL